MFSPPLSASEKRAEQSEKQSKLRYVAVGPIPVKSKEIHSPYFYRSYLDVFVENLTVRYLTGSQ